MRQYTGKDELRIVNSQFLIPMKKSLPDSRAIQAFFNRAAEGRDRWRRRNRAYHKEVLRFCRSVVPEGESVLVLGCGTGDLLAGLKPKRGLGIDFSEAMVRQARKKYADLEFRVGRAECLPEGERFEWIILSDLLGFLPDIQGVFSELWKVVLPGSRVLVTHYNPLWKPMLKAAEMLGFKMPEPVQNWLTHRDIHNLLYLCGFETIRRENRLLLPCGVPVLAWFSNRLLAKVPGLRRMCLIQTLVARPVFPAREASAVSCSVVVPCKNERGTVEEAIVRTPHMGAHTELLFVVGHSTDGTAEEVARCMAVHAEADIRLIRQAGSGKGDAVRQGFEEAVGDVLMILDGDLTVAPEDLPKFFHALVSGRAELAVGTRLIYPMEHAAMRFLNLLGNRFFGRVLSCLLGQRISDTLCGTKALFASDYRKVVKIRRDVCDFDPFGDFDLLLSASKLVRKIVEVPVRYRDRVYGTTQIHRFRHGYLLLRVCWAAFRKLC